MKIIAYTISGQKFGVDKTSWNENDFSGLPFSAITDNATIPPNYSDITSLLTLGKFGESCGLSFIDIRNEMKNFIPNDLSTLTAEELERVKYYQLNNYFKLYDKLSDGNVMVNDNPPVDINYDLLGYNKKRTFDKGELNRVEYYENYVQSADTYSVKVVEEIRTYYRVNKLLSRREMVINWLLNDGSTGYTKNTTKYYTLPEAIDAGETRRSNVITNLKINVLGLIMAASGVTAIVAQDLALPFLNFYTLQVSKYIQGFEDDLKNSINTDINFSWLDLVIPNTGGITIRQYLISELTIDYSINNINI